ncbi:YrpD family protein [Bacillus sp. C28GYM-DRY-1]|nr:YrpD family protein [Bacillus sp. C28GYM-DRY-1]MDO3659531.1 YrpD family protein [Bacillus sp. C28GYM-DRY-1]
MGEILIKKILIAGAVEIAVLFRTFSAGIPGLPAADTQVAKAATQLPKGIGGRAYLNSIGTVFTAKIKLPDTVKLRTRSLHLIFIQALGQQAELRQTSGSTANKNVWKPAMKAGAKNEETYIEVKDKFIIRITYFQSNEQ